MTSNNPKAVKRSPKRRYDDPSCAYCPPTVRACRQGEDDPRRPGFCPSRVAQDAVDEAFECYADPFVRKVAQESARVESEGYCRWTRVEEICAFARRMGFKKIGIATCISFVDQAYTLSGILESHGFEVASVACKHGSVAKEAIGLEDFEKIRPGGHESMCNPVSQAKLLNQAGCELNVVLGLCIGHDSLFFKYSEGLATTLVAKDRVLAHNPVGALNLADSYYAKVWGPERPSKPPKLPKQGRRRKGHGPKELLQWKDEYLLGLESLDFEHKDLFQCINDLYQQCTAPVKGAELEDCLGQLHARLAAHFALEERSMREMKNPHYDAHKAEHDQFLEEVTEVVAGFGTRPGEEYLEAFAVRVKEWILAHITTTDRQLVMRER